MWMPGCSQPLIGYLNKGRISEQDESDVNEQVVEMFNIFVATILRVYRMPRLSKIQQAKETDMLSTHNIKMVDQQTAYSSEFSDQQSAAVFSV